MASARFCPAAAATVWDALQAAFAFAAVEHYAADAADTVADAADAGTAVTGADGTVGAFAAAVVACFVAAVAVAAAAAVLMACGSSREALVLSYVP